MTPNLAALSAIDGALSLLPYAMDTSEARVMLYAIGMQESRFAARRQLGDGPARGFWQMEQGGGVKGVCEHPASRYWMAGLCKARGVAFTLPVIWSALERDDVLAAGAARLLVFTDPRSLPEVEDVDGSWNLYARVWRPGKPLRTTWPQMHGIAVHAIGVAAA